ncbi:MAG: hypothetical protein NT133_21580 [Alphaproteobacteria bacterium]|nr:hypothetical protein [Alphaproteobacteria bacterium]
MIKPRRSVVSMVRDRRGFTRLEFSLLTAMIGAMVINGIATLGGGLGGANKPIGMPDLRAEQTTTIDMTAATAYVGRKR